MRRSFRRISHWHCPLLLRLLLSLFLSALFPPSSFAHFALTFPETRYPPFDFLDSQRTVGPCGIPKTDRSPVTQFQAGKAYKITWRTAMEHKGKFRLRLLDSTGKALDNLLLRPNGTNLLEFTDATNANSVDVQFASVCRNCTLLMEKDAPELGEQITEKGCAEVDISTEAEKPCLGKGKSVGERCQCEQGFSGEQCQYRDDCTEDGDCGHGGRCVAGAIHHGQRSCFCPFGFIGTNCERKSSITPKDTRCFAHGGPRNGSANGNGSEVFIYGIFNPNCYSSRELNEDGDRIYWRLVGNQLELLLDFRTNSWLSLGWRPLNIPPSCRLFPQMHGTAAEGRHGEDGVQTSGFAKSALSLPLHPMDCTDVIMASVLEGTDLLHIADMYSRDRSSPLRDAWLDGEDSLSAAYGLATDDGRTVVMFRRMVPEIEPTDHPLGPGELFLIWAKGQPKKPKDKGFYSDGQWKYHGDSGSGRGHMQMEFVSLEQMGKIRGPLIHLDPPQGPTNTSEQRTAEKGREEEGKAMPTERVTKITIATTTSSVPTTESDQTTKTSSPEATTSSKSILTTQSQKTDKEQNLTKTEAKKEQIQTEEKEEIMQNQKETTAQNNGQGKVPEGTEEAEEETEGEEEEKDETSRESERKTEEDNGTPQRTSDTGGGTGGSGRASDAHRLLLGGAFAVAALLPLLV
ncbi:hypothetical protein niasHT_011356 [Heterodera trifolii]|uniref:EGF-like domain-containing protein n=1 Tax=Heterodera trifolii TaxID=157864 RepID=A0ABD2LI65_9BILA